MGSNEIKYFSTRRRERLKKLAQNVRGRDCADRGENVEMPFSPQAEKIEKPVEISPTKKPKSSKWAELASTRQLWEMDEYTQTTPIKPKKAKEILVRI